MEMHNWMQHIPNEMKIKDLTMPGSHNAGSYMTKNFIVVVKDFVVCQDLTVYQQLKSGVRVLDVRVAGTRRHSDNQIEYWCAHTFLTVPFMSVMNDIRQFMQENPTETVFLFFLSDHMSINSDYMGLANIKKKNRQRIFKPSVP